MEQNTAVVVRRYSGGDDRWRELAFGIVIQAVRDYTKVLHHLKKHTDDEVLIKSRDEIEDFFQSDWFEELCDWDGAEVIRQIRAVTNYHDQQEETHDSFGSCCPS